MSDCLILGADAEDLADEVARLSGNSLDLTVCTSHQQALETYSNQSIAFGNPEMIARVLPEMPSIRWVQSSWAGIKPLIENTRRDYVLTSAKGVFGPQITEYVFGYLLAHEVKVGQRQAAQQKHRWFPERSGSLINKRLGVMGTGSIGQHIASTAKHFEMKTIGLSRTGAAVENFDQVFDVARLEEFLGAVDYLVSTLPETSDTEGLLNQQTMGRLPPHAIFINVGRSNVVDHAALVEMLCNGKLAGAVLDVFDTEPLAENSEMWDVPNLAITAHIAAASHPALIAPVFVENYQRYRNSLPLNYIVDFDAGY